MPIRQPARAKSDSEESEPRSTRRGKDRSPPSKKNSKKRAATEEEEEEEVEEVQEEGDDEEEEYEIEKIIKAQKGMVKPGSMAYLIKWKGYSEAENSWVDESDLQAEELKSEFWQADAAKKQKAKQSTSGRKSEASTRRASMANIKPETSDTGKRGRKSTTKADSDVEMDVEEITEPERPKKKTKTYKKSNQPAVPPSRSASPSDRFSAQDENGNPNYDSGNMDKYLKLKDWTNVIDKIETVEQMENQELLVYFITKKGERSVQASSAIAQRAPGMLIEFYETHLRWRKEDPANEK